MSRPEKPHVISSGGAGVAFVHNNCSFAINSNIVHGPRPEDKGPPDEIYGMLEAGESLEHAFSHDPNVGISWKVWRTDHDTVNTSPIQLEWTWGPVAKRTWYDLSMIDAGKAGWVEMPENGDALSPADLVDHPDDLGRWVGNVGIEHPFKREGMSLTPYIGSEEVFEGNCKGVKCAAGDPYCTGAYNTWNDWGQQQDCSEEVSLKLVLCG
jgi:hypothetical protein